MRVRVRASLHLGRAHLARVRVRVRVRVRARVRVSVRARARARVSARVRVVSQFISITQCITHKVTCQWVTEWKREPG